MIRTDRRITTTTNNKTARRTMPSAAIPSTSSFGDQRGCAVDLQDFDAVARADDLVVVVGARAPDLAADLHAAAVAVDLLEDCRAAADEGSGAGAHVRWCLHVTSSDRAQYPERRHRHEDEREHLDRHARPGRGDDRGDRGSQRDGSKDKRRGGRLSRGEYSGSYGPKDPVGHSPSVLATDLSQKSSRTFPAPVRA